MSTQLDIANRALLLVGARQQISSLNPSDGSAEANAVSVLFQPTFEALGRSAHWNCLRKEVTLSLLQAAVGTPENPTGNMFPLPPFPWLYAYSYPSDCLQFQYITPFYPSNLGGVPLTTINNQAASYLPNGGMIKFVVQTIEDFNGTPILAILTNQSQAIGIYTANYNNPAIWDSQFQAAMVASLGVYLVPALSLSLPLMQLAIGTADRIIGMAKAADGREGVTVMDHLPDWIRARSGGQGMGIGFSLGENGAYIDMAWPDYNG